MIWVLNNKNMFKIIVLLFPFFVLSSIGLSAQQDRITVQRSLIITDTLTPDEIVEQLYRYKKWGSERITAKEWGEIKKILLSNKRKKTDNG